ncbi:conserved hypothetical protein [Leishmania major strain Friedlin]|uniref:Uncharacterized protein n=1 Tax=Leishmania major TaxID=5664 RepID=Q4QFD6_LEIMA|nr:conserved hypothetical protein [Leishmania major strain Friedlin]CAG9571395.1 hypothetical_protein_-_conserved [Leishmania major strain Friedlin]CAJ03273.1 conserved hypothetical protein [Leishmania major strain Friedlin]|eukprot:XP_001681962.1 conserved hypothetical protein [Leishmania major strain Friedlin]
MWRGGTNAAPPRSASMEGLGGDGGGSSRRNSQPGSAAPAATSASRKWPLRSLFSAGGGSGGLSDADSARQYQLHKKNDTADSDGGRAAAQAMQLSSSSLIIDKGLETQEHGQQQHVNALVVDQSSRLAHMPGVTQVRQRHGVLVEPVHPRASDASPLAQGVRAGVEDWGDGDDWGSSANALEQQALPELSTVTPPSAPGTAHAADSDDVFVSDVALAHPRHPRASQTAAQELTYTPRRGLPPASVPPQQATASASATVAPVAATQASSATSGRFPGPSPHRGVSPTSSLAAYTPAPAGFHSGIRGLRSACDRSSGGGGTRGGNEAKGKSADLTKRRKRGFGAVAVLPSTLSSSLPSAGAHTADNAEPVTTVLAVQEAERQRLAKAAEAAEQRRSWAHAVQEILEQIADACGADAPTPVEVSCNVVYPGAKVTEAIHVARQLLEKARSSEASRANALDGDGDAVRNYGTVVRMLAAHTQTAVEREGGECEVDRHRIQRTRQLVLETWQSISVALPGIWRRAWASAMAALSEDKQLPGVRSLAALMGREPITLARRTAVALGTLFMQCSSRSDRPLGVSEVHAGVVAGLEAVLKSSAATATVSAASTAPTVAEMPPWAMEIVAATAEAMVRRDEMIKQQVVDVASTAAAVDDCGNADRAMRRARVQLREGSWTLWYVLRVLGLLAWWERMLPHLIPCPPPSAEAHTEAGATDAWS